MLVAFAVRALVVSWSSSSRLRRRVVLPFVVVVAVVASVLPPSPSVCMFRPATQQLATGAASIARNGPLAVCALSRGQFSTVPVVFCVFYLTLKTKCLHHYIFLDTVLATSRYRRAPPIASRGMVCSLPTHPQLSGHWFQCRPC